MTNVLLPVAGASALLVNSHGEYLLHLRDDVLGIMNPGAWSLVGGGREEGETLDETVARELDEEVGLQVPGLRPYAVVENRSLDGGATCRVQVYLGVWDGDPSGLTVSEGIMVRFFDLNTIGRLRMAPWAKDLVLRHAQRH
ncbi:NUDIX hydrolase [Streptomyces sp. NPDC051014]|uniref:NUDIX hydrolase n=1 Tax=Streptomyces sp. NPDC051014 TaxID=3155751 RepID=UPI0033C8AE46